MASQTDCARFDFTSDSLLKDVESRGARAFIDDWMYRIDPDGVTGAWDCILEGIGTAEPGWLRLAATLRKESDGASAEDLSAAMGWAVDSHPERALRSFIDNGETDLDWICGEISLGADTSKWQSILAQRKEKVSLVTAADIRPAREACLRGILEAEERLRSNP